MATSATCSRGERSYALSPLLRPSPIDLHPKCYARTVLVIHSADTLHMAS